MLVGLAVFLVGVFYVGSWLERGGAGRVTAQQVVAGTIE